MNPCPRNQLGNQSPKSWWSFQDWLFWRDFLGAFVGYGIRMEKICVKIRKAWNNSSKEKWWLILGKTADSDNFARLKQRHEPPKHYSLFLWTRHCVYYWSSWHTTRQYVFQRDQGWVCLWVMNCNVWIKKQVTHKHWRKQHCLRLLTPIAYSNTSWTKHSHGMCSISWQIQTVPRWRSVRWQAASLRKSLS